MNFKIRRLPAQCNPHVFKRRRGRQEEWQSEEDFGGFEDEDRPLSQKCGKLLETGEDKKTDSHLEPSEGTWPCLILPQETHSGPPTSRIIKYLCCFKPQERNIPSSSTLDPRHLV